MAIIDSDFLIPSHTTFFGQVKIESSARTATFKETRLSEHDEEELFNCQEPKIIKQKKPRGGHQPKDYPRVLAQRNSVKSLQSELSSFPT